MRVGERGFASLLAVAVLLVAFSLAATAGLYGFYGRRIARTALHNVELPTHAQTAAARAFVLVRDHPALLAQLQQLETAPILDEQAGDVRLVVNGRYLEYGERWQLACMAERGGDHAGLFMTLSAGSGGRLRIDGWRNASD